jgi:hypothetical protein
MTSTPSDAQDIDPVISDAVQTVSNRFGAPRASAT